MLRIILLKLDLFLFYSKNELIEKIQNDAKKESE